MRVSNSTLLHSCGSGHRGQGWWGLTERMPTRSWSESAETAQEVKTKYLPVSHRQILKSSTAPVQQHPVPVNVQRKPLRQGHITSANMREQLDRRFQVRVVCHHRPAQDMRCKSATTLNVGNTRESAGEGRNQPETLEVGCQRQDLGAGSGKCASHAHLSDVSPKEMSVWQHQSSQSSLPTQQAPRVFRKLLHRVSLPTPKRNIPRPFPAHVI